MKRYYYTYFDINYLVKGLALIQSLRRHENGNFRFFVICMDQITQSFINHFRIPNVTAVNMADIERAIGTPEEYRRRRRGGSSPGRPNVRGRPRRPETTVEPYMAEETSNGENIDNIILERYGPPEQSTIADGRGWSEGDLNIFRDMQELQRKVDNGEPLTEEDFAALFAYMDRFAQD